MTAATALMLALLLPLLAAVSLGAGAWLTSLLPLATAAGRRCTATVAFAALAASVVLLVLASSSVGQASPSLQRYALQCGRFPVAWHMATALTSLILLAGFRLYGSPRQAASLLLASGVTTIAGYADDILLQIVCVEIAAAAATRAGLSGPSTGPSRRPAFLTRIGPFLLLATGGLLLYGVCGSTKLAVAGEVMRSAWQLSPQGDVLSVRPPLVAVVGSVLLTCGVAGRLVLSIPADARGRTPVAGTTSARSGVVWLLFPRGAALVVLLRLAESILPLVHQPAATTLLVLCLVASLVHSLQFSAERRLPRLLHCMAGVQVAVLLTGVLAVVLHNSPVGVEPAGNAAFDPRSLLMVTAAAFFLETLAITGLHLILESLRQPGIPLEWEEELAGLARCRPVTGGAVGLLLLAAVGAIPLMTCWPRLLLLQAVFSVHPDPAVKSAPVLVPALPAAALCALCSQAALAVATLRMLSVVLLEPPRRRMTAGNRVLPTVLAVLLATGLLAGGLLPFTWWAAVT